MNDTDDEGIGHHGPKDRDRRPDQTADFNALLNLLHYATERFIRESRCAPQMQEARADVVAEYERACAERDQYQKSNRENENQLCRIAQFTGRDATKAPDSDRTIAGATIAELAAERQRGEAQAIACREHRACCGVEHDPANGKLHGCCIICGVPWPCDVAKQFGARDDALSEPPR